MTKRSKTMTPNKRVVIPIVVAFALIVVVFLLNITAYIRYSTLDTARKDIEHELLLPAGAIKNKNSSLHPIVGTLLDTIDLRCAASNCPVSSSEWYIPISPGDEASFIKSIVSYGGYKISEDATDTCEKLYTSKFSTFCGVEATNKQFKVNLELLKPASIQAGIRSVNPKYWLLIDINLRYRQ